jgi:hypothetical protein
MPVVLKESGYKIDQRVSISKMEMNS